MMSSREALAHIECLGVFQGGGVKAVAHAGAYEVVHNFGFRFSAIAGTSAGSIIASLICAGASPQDIISLLETLDFEKLILPPETLSLRSSKRIRLLCWLLTKMGRISPHLPIIGKIVSQGGLHSSSGIQSWLNKELLNILGDCDEQVVRFRHLKKELYVVATDITTGKPRVWSRQSTPNESVALAVRASCSIPIFFQPIINGLEIWVDGGVVSNLPSFVFSSDSTRSNMRTLAFCLLEESAVEATSLAKLATQLLDSVIVGGTAVQLATQNNVRSIKIRTEGFATTDFAALKQGGKKLIELGQHAAKQFVESEAVNWLRATYSHEIFDIDQVYLAVVRQHLSKGDEVIIAEKSTAWYWQIFPTILCWVLAGVKIRVYVPHFIGAEAKERQREYTRQENMKGLGVEIYTLDELPAHAYVFSKNQGNLQNAIVLNVSGNAHAPVAYHYDAEAHQSLISLLFQQLDRLSPKVGPSLSAPKLERMDEGELCRVLKQGVEQYNEDRVSLAIENVIVENVKCITRQVRQYKYEQMLNLVAVLERHGLDRFEPCAVVLIGGERSILAPPVFEQHGTVLVGIEGNTRSLYSYIHKIRTIRAVVVRGVQVPLPGDGITVREMCTIEHDEKPKVRMPGFVYGRFRRIEGACHPLKRLPQ